MAYTYEDFLNKMQAAGLTESQFSSYDLDLAKKYPEAGIGLINAKYNYVNAQTDDERALANAEAEGIRTKYGNYTGGQYGTGYTPQGPAPSSYTAPEAPAYSFAEAAPTYVAPQPYQNQYSDTQQQLLNSMLNYQPFEYAPYQNQYSGAQQQLINDMLNYKPFEYADYQNQYADKQKELLDLITGYGPFEFDPATSPLYSSYKKQYTREGNRAMQDTLGSLAAATGGRPSTAAVAAAGQANDYYMSQLGDKLPQIYETEYNKYLQDFGMLQNKLGAVNQMEGMDYSRYWDGKNFDYARYLDDYERMQSNLGATDLLEQRDYAKYTDNRNFDYGKYLDDYARLNTNLGATNMLEQSDYNRYDRDRAYGLDVYRTDLGQYNADRNYGLDVYRTDLDKYNKKVDFDYGQLLDQIEYDRDKEQTAYNRSLDKWEQKFKFNEATATQKEKEFNRMMDLWKATGRAPQNVADYFGVEPGTYYGGAESELALEQARADIAYTNQRIKESQSAEAENYAQANKAASGNAGSGATAEDSAIDAALDRLYARTGTAADIQTLIDAGFVEEKLREAFPYMFEGGSQGTGETAPDDTGTDWRDAYDPASLKQYKINTEADLDRLLDTGKYTLEMQPNGKLKIRRISH